jgi:hypothetical protein
VLQTATLTLTLTINSVQTLKACAADCNPNPNPNHQFCPNAEGDVQAALDDFEALRRINPTLFPKKLVRDVLRGQSAVQRESIKLMGPLWVELCGAIDAGVPSTPSPLYESDLMQSRKSSARCAFFYRNSHLRKPLVPTPARLKLLQACDQWHSSQVSTFLTSPHCKLRPNTEGTVRVFRQKFTLEDAIGSHACSLEALTCV